jgi:hypothetical protein
MITDELLLFKGKAIISEIVLYQRKVRAITYTTTSTRPDIARASQKLAEFLTNPSPNHIAAADRVIIYLYRTRYLAI